MFMRFMTIYNQKEYFNYEIVNEYIQSNICICKNLITLRRILTTSGISRQSPAIYRLSIPLTFCNMLHFVNIL